MMKVISKKVSCVNSDLNDDGAKEANVVSELLPMTNAAGNAFSETLSGSRTVKIISYIEVNYSDRELTVKSIADEFGITANYLSAYFKKQTGASLSDYITKYRIEKSKELLKENLLIKEVAYHSGFNDANVYNRAFKKIEGITPRQYKLKN